MTATVDEFFESSSLDLAKHHDNQMIIFPSSLWDDLPDDLCLEIFHRLYHANHSHGLKQVSLVSKRFLLLSNSVRTNLFIWAGSKSLNYLPIFCSRFTHISTIELFGLDLNVDNIISQLAQFDLPIQFLKLWSQANFPADGMRLLGPSKCKTLKSIGYEYNDDLTDEDLAVVADYFPYIQNLNIRANPLDKSHVTDIGIWDIATKLKSLYSLDIVNHENVSHRAFEYLASNSPLLRTLATEFYGYDCVDCLEQFRHLKSLTSLELKGEIMSHYLLVYLQRANLKLSKLRLDYPESADDIDNALFCGFLKSFSFLCHLELNGSFPYPYNLEAVDFVASIPHLKVIKLSSYPWNSNPPPISTFFHLLKSCPFLEDICICCDCLNQDWLSIPTHSNVRKLYFDECEFTDESLVLIASICSKLESLVILEGGIVTLKGIESIVSGYSNLKCFSVTRCNEVSEFEMEKS